MIKKFISNLLSSKTTEDSAAPGSPEVLIRTQKVLLFETNPTRLEEIMNSPFPEGEHPGYVYFVQEYLNGSFKIGKTKHINKRMNLFNVKLPFEHQLVHLIKSGNHHQTEIAFHKHFAQQRLEGEWFALDAEDVKWLRSERYTEEINSTIKPAANDDDEKQLTPKQIEFAKTLIKKLEDNYTLNVDYSHLTNKDLSRLSVYFRFKNEKALQNLVKKGVLSPKQKVHK
ncbi:GIY-YIG nuclease family protein [Bacillus salacetis]|uniref:GIY-YIG nuclease family protein n=1 Tax=Bacillus salacetis TaxID=2315464 RepID=A0A3A1QSY9_9BACI|nr:GIY-YIG nuclease family protein [Bacillus salacetis]RIW30697.1 GIY-YIG nuclease family protein [Bacillus salacetis]